MWPKSTAIDLKPRKYIIYALRGRLAWPKVSYSRLLTEQVNARSPGPPTLSQQFRRRSLCFPARLRHFPGNSVGGVCIFRVISDTFPPFLSEVPAFQNRWQLEPVPARARTRTCQKQWQSEKDVRLRKKWLVLLLKFCNFAGMKF